MTRTVSPAGRSALMAREGCRLAAYRDSVGVLTIGVDHTGRAGPPAVVPGMTITRAQAEAIFADDLAPFEAAVAAAVAATSSLTANQFDACVSLAFNIGARGFAGSTVVHRIAAGDHTGAAEAFLMWEHPPELAARRRAERAQFLRADAGPPAASPALPPEAVSERVPLRPPRPAVAGPHILPPTLPPTLPASALGLPGRLWGRFRLRLAAILDRKAA